MRPERRLEALVDVTLDLLREHGLAVTTKQIAEAAGVAEGTIFRVVDSKDELVDAAIARAFAPGAVIDRIAEIDPDLPLEARLTQLVAVLQQRFRATFALMQKVGLVRPPDHLHEGPEATRWRDCVHERMCEVLGEDVAVLRVERDAFLQQLRLLTFAGSHPHIADGDLLTPEQIVSTLLHGLLKHPEGRD